MAEIEQTRAVIEEDESYDGTLMPTVKAELDRSVRVRDGATVEGSVYGGTVELFSDATVEGSVMASDSIEAHDARVVSEAGTPGRILAEKSRFDGTITGKRVRISDCVVLGNIAGGQVSIENCLVLGIVSADEELTLESSLCYTFRSHGTTTIGDATIVLPQAIADGEIDFESPVKVAGLGTLELEDDTERLPEMAESDLYRQNSTTYLTLSPRILNLEKVTDRLAELESMIRQTVVDTVEGDDDVRPAAVLDALEVDEDKVPTRLG